MPYPRKYTPEQRRRACEMYWEEREDPKDTKRAQGKNKLWEIEAETGIPAKVAWLIARGYK